MPILLRWATALLAIWSLTAASPVAAKPPNVVLILVDDAALMDFGAFGGEAHTPNIDRLTARGAMFTGYHTSPLCSPSRSMLLTGVDNHRAGVATIEEILPPSQKGKHGYGLHFEPGVLTLADRFRAAGYRTAMAGKWHLGHGPGDLPNSHGFDRSLALDASGADNWQAKPYMPYYDEAPWFEDGRRAAMPADYYSSDLLVDRLIGYLDGGSQPKPFFAYLAFQAVHIPVQAPKAYSDHYRGAYDQGWAAIRQARGRRAQQLGLIPPGAPYRDMPAFARAWDKLAPADRKIYARSMEVYSGMLEAMDASVGRLVDHLAAKGQLDSTIFVVTSDNGPEPSDPVHAKGMDLWMAQHGYQWSLDHMGEKGSLTFIGLEWASAISSPGNLFKFYVSEGGIHVPLILSGPGITPSSRVASSAFVTDVAPTLLELTGVGALAPGGSVSLDGRSLVPALAADGPVTHGEDDPVGIEVSGNAALFRGGWKLMRDLAPFGDGTWRLYDLAHDPGETHDLAKAEPERFKALLADYDAYAKRVGVLEVPKGFDSQKQVRTNALVKQVGFLGPKLAAGVLGLAVVVLGLIWLLRRPRR